MQTELSPPDVTAWRQLGSLVRALENECRLLHARYVSHCQKLTLLISRLRSIRSQSIATAARRAAG
jgi:hypothetical protein